MKVHVLVENSSNRGGPEGEHGLSLFIETKEKVILFDTGQGDRFVRNAEILGADLGKVDATVISHGHYDHGGGIAAFLEANGRAPVYVHRRGFETHLSLQSDGGYADIGLDPSLENNSRIMLTDGETKIFEGALLFCDVESTYPVPSGNGTLFSKIGNVLRSDDFGHEQSLVLEEDGKIVLVAGCSHRGIANIVEKAKDMMGRYPDTVIGGFHLRSWSGGPGNGSEVRRVSDILLETGARFYTGHCTGETAYGQMKEALGDRI
ncbi:MAG: 7,8-dihydropterin-6-yl-methyl-4-(beta-D-ribofuranosyl)aminobenzene 5-phosphate synthase [Candidatus Methanomethylophilaceae archaeon]|nr:7,8-dihydropterin-6-yl-methyl-4-(beta-D-ribofuranosyl)aminobenzene 5-phosphate synthase [Candidatus Methanomethylophilaceae archaeon]